MPVRRRQRVQWHQLALRSGASISNRTATRLAIIFGIAQLFAWGFVLGRRLYHTWTGALLAAFGDGAVGLVIVLLEVWVNH